MLSAVQARKNRLHQQNASGTASPTPATKHERATSTPGVPGKRKASNIGVSSRKKKSKPTSLPKDSRYFQNFAHNDDVPDVIVVEDEDDNSVVPSDNDSSDESVSSVPRAWSPSRHVVAGIDDMMVENDLFATPARKKVLPTDVPTLSTFTLIDGKNFFPISSEEMGAFEIQCPHDHHACIVLLSAQETLALVGVYKLRVLRGLITLAGVTLEASTTSHRVFAPRSAAIPVMQSQPQEAIISTTVPTLPARVQAISDTYATALLLEECRTGVEGLGKVIRTFDDVFDSSRPKGRGPALQLGLRGVHIITVPPHGVYPYTLPDSWRRALSSCMPTASSDMDYSRKVFFVKGAKKSGKSTFARTLLNRLSTQYRFVAFLECDLGQSEFTPGGLVALNIVSSPIFGPPFTHPSIPYQAHYIGSTTPQSSPSQYLAAIEALVYTYNTDVQHASYDAPSRSIDGRVDDFIPLVVNMMGWTKGLGADLTDRIEEMLQPSAVFECEAPKYDDGWMTPAPSRGEFAPRYEASSLDPRSYPVHRLSPIVLSSAVPIKYSPADLRQLSILSYFHAAFQPEQTDSLESPLAQSWDTTLPLCAQAPYELSCDTALDLVALEGPGSEDVVVSEVHRVLTGAIVALVSHETGTLDVELDTSVARPIPYSPGTPSPSPTDSVCHGLALIRSVSSSHPAFLHILTPLPPQTLTKTHPRVLVKGELELPVWGMLDFRSDTHIAGMAKMDVPYLKWGTISDAVGSSKRKARRNLMRKGQM